MIIITGASKGIGEAVATRLTTRGISVLGLARSFNQDKTYAYKTIECDISNPDSIKSVVSYIKKNSLGISGLINAAGIASMNLAVLTTAQKSLEIISTNLLGTIYCCQLFSPLLMRRKSGHIINFSTIAVPLGLKGESIYVASKGGVESFSRSFAKEMTDFGITVNCIAPGPIETGLISGIPKHKIDEIIKNQIIQKKFTKDDICDVIEIILDKKSDSLTGHIFRIGGF